jgi:hypothetical protein
MPFDHRAASASAILARVAVGLGGTRRVPDDVEEAVLLNVSRRARKRDVEHGRDRFTEADCVCCLVVDVQVD